MKGKVTAEIQCEMPTSAGDNANWPNFDMNAQVFKSSNNAF